MYVISSICLSSYLVTSRQKMAAELNDKIVKKVNSLMLEDKAKTQSTFDKVSPLINEVFIALANYDVRFDFSLLSLDSCNVEKVIANEYNVLCPLKELPEENLRLEGKDGTGVLTVRLSRACKVRWGSKKVTLLLEIDLFVLVSNRKVCLYILCPPTSFLFHVIHSSSPVP